MLLDAAAWWLDCPWEEFIFMHWEDMGGARKSPSWMDCLIFLYTSSYKDFWVCSSGTYRKLGECRQSLSLTQKCCVRINSVLPRQGHAGQMCRHLTVGPTCGWHAADMPPTCRRLSHPSQDEIIVGWRRLWDDGVLRLHLHHAPPSDSRCNS